MNNNKLDSKRKLSLDDDDISFKKKTRKETNLLSSSSKDYTDNHNQVDLTSLNNVNVDIASRKVGSWSYNKTSNGPKAINKKNINLVNRHKNYFTIKIE